MISLSEACAVHPLPLLLTPCSDVATAGARPWERRPFSASPDKEGSRGNRKCVGVPEGLSLHPSPPFNSRAHPWVSHGGVSNQGRKTTVLNISNWRLETIVLQATRRKMWGEWVSELGRAGEHPGLGAGKATFISVHRQVLFPKVWGL